jgi:Ca2+-binding RTX toxin-like protein
MATLSTHVALDMDDWNLGNPADGDIRSHNNHHFLVRGDADRTYDFGGEGFDYFDIGGFVAPTDGEIESLTIADAGNTILTLTGISIDVETAYGFLAADQFDALIAYLFAEDDTITGSKFGDILRAESGDDVIKAGKGADSLNGGLGADKLKGGVGADSFFYAGAFESTSTAYDSVLDFSAADDVFVFDVAVTAIDTAITAGALSKNDFDSDLADAADDAHLGANHAVLFTPNAGKHAGETFLVVDLNGEAGYDVGEDAVIRLTDTSGLGGLSTANFIAD